ncbi:MAG: hypothetical protein J5873_03320 [Bacteroidales bacterium]|nr:hypothetical protein [Bacteroidales bacterium]
MMKRACVLLMVLFGLNVMAFAQQVSCVTATLNKDVRPAFSMAVDHPRKIVEEAVAKRLKKDKIKGKSVSGTMVYSKVNNRSIGLQNATLYTRVESVGKSANLYFFVEKENGNFVTETDTEAAAVIRYMASLEKDVDLLAQTYRVEDQKKVYEKAEKEYQKLVSKQNKLEKQIQQADRNRQEQRQLLEEYQKQAR